MLSKQCSLHISLELEGAEAIALKPERTHLHCVQGFQNGDGQQKLEVAPSYSRAVIIEFANRKLRDLGLKQIGSQKFNFGPTVLKPVTKIFEDTKDTCDTKWSLCRSETDQPHAVHEALRRFFCLNGAVSSEVSVSNLISVLERRMR